MTIIEPTVGRIVWYWPGATSGLCRLARQPHAAQIVGVHNDRCVNLAVCDSAGNHYSMTSVELVQSGDPLPASGYASWMPFQIGQAKKHEATRPEQPADEPQPCDCEQGPIHLVQAPNVVINAHNVYLERD
jgi:hypothetical protein